MANWAIGDVQGCLGALRRLLAAIEAQDAQAQFYFCGDLINRGEDSLGTLVLIQSLGSRAHTVLGNHDLYALACVAGFVQPKAKDTLDALLAAPHAWVDWLRAQPLAINIDCDSDKDGFLLTHAGVWPAWSTAQTLGLAAQVQHVLRARDWAQQLRALWHGGARQWQDDLNALDAQRFTINALMRMRLIAPDGGLDFDLKEAASAAPAGYSAWFEMPSLAMRERVLVFGHWSALGLRNLPRMIALDTGCVWGRQLTAVELINPCEHRRVIQVSA